MPAPIIIERLLDDAAHSVGNALTVIAENVLRRTPADRLAHGAFGDLPHHFVRVSTR